MHPFVRGAPAQSLVCQVVLYEANVVDQEQPAFAWCIGQVEQHFGPFHGGAYAAFSWILVLLLRLTLPVINAHGTAEVQNSFADLVLCPVTDDPIHGSPFPDLVHQGLGVVLVGLAQRVHSSVL